MGRRIGALCAEESWIWLIIDNRESNRFLMKKSDIGVVDDGLQDLGLGWAEYFILIPNQTPTIFFKYILN